jgi:UDP-GlcNAc3NAcA epimerase
MLKIITIVGARPQFIKAAVVSRAIAEHNSQIGSGDEKIHEIIVHSGQHYDLNMSAVFFEEMQIPKPDHFLEIKNLPHGAMTGRMLESIESVLQMENPDLVMVYGDTNTTLAGALATAKLHIPVAHVEAGLRSFNRQMPEEINRVLTDHLSTILFCPTKKALENLQIEGIGIQRRDVSDSSNVSIASVELVGDVMLDAALHYRQFAHKPDIDIPANFVLATIHRAENTEDKERLMNLFRGLELISQQCPILLPLHPRTRKILKDYDLRPNQTDIQIIEPLGYLNMVYLLERCLLVLTDSGGLQKEAFFFNKPCITLRDETEWIELIDHGYNLLVGADSERIRSGFHLMTKKSLDFSKSLYGNGHSGKKIKNLLIDYMNKH